MRGIRRRSPERFAGLPEPVRAVLGSPSPRILAVAREARSAAYLIATTTQLYAVSAPSEGAAPEVLLTSPWHLVATGSWSGEASTLTVTWVDARPTTVWHIDGPGTFAQVFRERTQASVVLTEEVDLGAKRTARVVVRRNLDSGALLSQVILGRGVRANDPGVREQCDQALAALREQVGLD